MKPIFISILVVLLGQGTLRPDPPKECDDCPRWNAPREPFRIFGNSYFVGVADLSSVLIVSDNGMILVDGGLPQSAPLIDANIRKLGFKTENVRLIVNSHAHFDHAGGIAALQRASGGTVAMSAAGARALEQGLPTPDDPQYALGRQIHELSAGQEREDCCRRGSDQSRGSRDHGAPDAWSYARRDDVELAIV